MASETIKVLYIGGYGRSGSTLLVQLLGQIEGFHSVGEMWNIWQQCFAENQLCGCGKPFHECPFWCAVVEEAFGGFEELELEEINRLAYLMRSPQYFLPVAYPRLRTAAQKQNIKAYLTYLKRLYAAIKKVSGSQIIVDSSKGPRYAMLLNEIPEIDLRVVHLIRDSRGVVYSWQKKRVKPEVYWKTEYMDRVNPVSAAFLWNFTNLFMQALNKSGAAYLFVRYEDLIDSPHTWLANIIQLTGENLDQENPLDGANTLNDSMIKQPVEHTAGGNPSRYYHGTISLRPDNEWREKMPEVQKYLVTAMTALLMHKYGYSTSCQERLQLKPAVDNHSALAENERSLG